MNNSNQRRKTAQTRQLNPKSNPNQNPRNANSNNAKRRKARARGRQNPSGVPGQNVNQVSNRRAVSVSDCARKYWATLANPITGPMGCVPGSLPLNTFKQRCFARGTVHSGGGANNFGWIIVDPLNFGTNDVFSVYHTIAGYAGGPDIINGADVQGVYSNSNYSISSLDDSQGGESEMRVVGLVLRIRYIGTALNMGGTYTAFHDPNHWTLANQSGDFIGGQERAKIIPITNDWVNVYYAPANNTDYDLITITASPFPGPGSSASRFYMGIVINGATPGAPFAYQVYGVHEFAGKTIRGTTLTETDPLGLSAGATVASASLPNSLSPEANEASFIGRCADFLATGITTVQNVATAVNTVRNAVRSTGALNVNLPPYVPKLHLQ
jgi:hypothetical protein